MFGWAMLGVGALLIWGALTGKGDKIISALQMQLPTSKDTFNPGTGKDFGGKTGSTPPGTDSGTHQGIDANGNVITIDKPYGSMTDAEKDAANAFAHQIGNLASNTG